MLGKFIKKNELLDGEQIRYFSNGKVKAKLNYKNGIENGEFLVYYETGKLLLKEFFVMGKRHGKQVRYNEDGTIEKVVEYNNGVVIEDGTF